MMIRYGNWKSSLDRIVAKVLIVVLMVGFVTVGFVQDELPSGDISLTTNVALNFRASPDGDAFLLDQIPAETTITATGRTSGWVQVEYNGQVGWIADGFGRWDGNPELLTNPFNSNNETVPFNAYVTTQDHVSFRVGPGLSFERTEVLPPGVTMPAIGRTADGTWIQVVYNGQNGWIADWLLVWTGDIIDLELDGVNPVPFVRRTLAEVMIEPDTPIYSEGNLIYPDIVGLVAEPTRLELTGRLGSAGVRRLQFAYNGRYYWVLNTQVEIYGTTLKLMDLSANAPYGRLLGKVRTTVNITSDPLNQIGGLWSSLAAGGTITCERIPRPVRMVTFTAADLQAEPEFVPSARAAEAAIVNTNNAIAALEDLCAGTGVERFATPEEIQVAETQIETARRNLYIAQTFFSPLAERDPILGD